MIILTIRTDKPESEIGLFENGNEIAYETWQAHRQLAETLHTKIKELLHAQDKSMSDLQGIVVYKGPGSFTGLRIGISVANSLAYGLNIKAAGATTDNWIKLGLAELESSSEFPTILPDYGSPVFITTPRK